MKKFNKILLILSLVLCLAGIVLCAGGALAGGIDDAQNIAGARLQRYDQEKTLLDDFTALDADLSVCSMEIRPSDDTHAYLEYHIEGTRENTPVHANVQDGILQLRDENYTISRSNIEQILTGFLWLLPDAEREAYANDGSIILYLPAATYDSIQLTLAMGNLSVDSLQATRFTADLALGSLTLTGTTLSQSDIDVAMGTLTGENLTFNGDATIEVNTGNAELTLSPESRAGLLIDANTDMGNITAPDSWGGNLLDTDDVVANHYRRTPQGTPTGSLSISADMGEIIFR
ncbi:MAG: DUF4097 family beta strand repeat-containing protein [Peptococcaceae bacterium]|nr:DUF4097 family beta strand repeat-containing protein [Peptococcaceae bacterium]